MIGPAYGLHSSLEDQVTEQLKLYFHKIQFKDLQIPVITNVDGVYVTTPSGLESAIIRKNNHRNQWLEVIQGFAGCDVILSVGPGSQLLEWFKEEFPDKDYYQISTVKDLEHIAHLYKKEESVVSEITEVNQVTQTLYDADEVNERASDFDIEEEE